MNSAIHDTVASRRRALRTELLARHAAFVAGPGLEEASASLARHLATVLMALEPERLGLYWAMVSEFNAVQALGADSSLAKLAICLPFAQRRPPRLHYRAWQRGAATMPDECGIPASAGPAVDPDVVLVPCVGYTRAGHRLGFGGGYFDRWLAAHPDVTAVGVAWQAALLPEGSFEPEPHDIALALVVTEAGVA